MPASIRRPISSGKGEAIIKAATIGANQKMSLEWRILRAVFWGKYFSKYSKSAIRSSLKNLKIKLSPRNAPRPPIAAITSGL